MSTKKRAEREAAKPIRDAYRKAHPNCELAGAPNPCFDEIHVHEVFTQARGGPIDDPRNFASACNYHNTAVSQFPMAMIWALDNGFLVKRREGKEWLEAGGRMPPGTTKEEAVAALMGD